jgi:hypothetical protein
VAQLLAFIMGDDAYVTVRFDKGDQPRMPL